MAQTTCCHQRPQKNPGLFWYGPTRTRSGLTSGKLQSRLGWEEQLVEAGRLRAAAQIHVHVVVQSAASSDPRRQNAELNHVGAVGGFLF